MLPSSSRFTWLEWGQSVWTLSQCLKQLHQIPSLIPLFSHILAHCPLTGPLYPLLFLKFPSSVSCFLTSWSGLQNGSFLVFPFLPFLFSPTGLCSSPLLMVLIHHYLVTLCVQPDISWPRSLCYRKWRHFVSLKPWQCNLLSTQCITWKQDICQHVYHKIIARNFVCSLTAVCFMYFMTAAEWVLQILSLVVVH
jgi:hypothetical protein